MERRRESSPSEPPLSKQSKQTNIKSTQNSTASAELTLYIYLCMRAALVSIVQLIVLRDRLIETKCIGGDDLLLGALQKA